MDHAPGPWFVRDLEVVTANNVFVASVEGELRTPEDEANARLISASPDLLQACRCALADLEGSDYPTDSERLTMEDLRAAIAKAEGRT